MKNKEIIRELEELGIKINEHTVALSPNNDPYKMNPGKIKDAEWITDIWKKEGSPIIHARDLHYTILDKHEVTILMKKEGDTESKPYTFLYENTDQCWGKLGAAIKNAQYLGLIPYESIKDMKNTYFDELGSFRDNHSSFYYSPTSHINLEDEDVFLEGLKQRILNGVDLTTGNNQKFYMEIWSEKAGVIPVDIAEKYGMTIRECGGGEPSLDMAYKAVKRAQELNKSLFVFHLTDSDPKGDLSMVKGAARKIEYVARDFGVEAFYDKICLTKEQCKKYSLPEVPAKIPKNNKPRAGQEFSPGYKAYTTLTNRQDTGTKTTEINALKSRLPDDYKNEIENAIRPFFDSDIESKNKQCIEDYIAEVKDNVDQWIEENKEEILKQARILYDSYKEVEEELKPLDKQISELGQQLQTLREERDEKRSKKEAELKIEKKRMDYEATVELDDIDVDIPDIKPDYEYPDTLLDTNRDYMDQIKYYKDWDKKFG